MMTSKTVQEISHTARIKSYPDGSMDILAAERPIFHSPGWEASNFWAAPAALKQPEEPLEEQAQEPLDEQAQEPQECGDSAAVADKADVDRAMRRAKAQVRDIALCNGFQWFVTLTLDAAVVDRYDMGPITKKLNAWLDNQVRRKGLRYVLVPERHKDGAIHFHGFFSDALEAVDSGTMTGCGWKKPRKPRSAAQRAQWLAAGARVVYNLPGWSLGFTTALEVYGDYHSAVGYVCKYIGKQGEKPGGRWYYSGGKLAKPAISYADLAVSDVAAMDGAYTFCVQEARLGMALWRTKGGEQDGQK